MTAVARLFEVWYLDRDQVWRYVGVGQDRRGAREIIGEWCPLLRAGVDDFRITPIRAGEQPWGQVGTR